MKNHYRKNATKRARTLRRESTRHENKLWYDYLSEYPLRWTRQKPIGRYIVDFYCHAAQLVIELDGDQHFTEQSEAYDRKRTEILNKKGIHVLRFDNIEIDQSFDGVCETIDGTVQQRMQDQ